MRKSTIEPAFIASEWQQSASEASEMASICTFAKDLTHAHQREDAALMAGKARTDRTVQRARDAFLSELAKGRSISAAAVSAGLARRTVYDWREADSAFAAAWDDALEAGTDLMEDEAARRGVEGVEEPIVAMGRLAKDDQGNILTRRVYSDSLLLATLRRRRAEWRERITQDQNLKADVAVSVESPRERIASRIAGLAARIGAAANTGEPERG